MYPIINLGSGTELPSYLVYLSLLYSFLLWFTVRKSQKENKSVELVLNLSLIIMVAGFLGARLLHVLYENPDYYKEDYRRLFQFWEGGFVFYGGAIAAVLGSILYLKLKKISPAEWLDFFAPVGSLGYALGRFACLLAGCCYGGTCAYPWALQGKHPTQIYAIFWELCVFGILWKLRLKQFQPGTLFAIWMIGHGLGRLVMEYFRVDFRGDLIFGLSISTWVSLVIVGLGLTQIITGRFGKTNFR